MGAIFLIKYLIKNRLLSLITVLIFAMTFISCANYSPNKTISRYSTTFADDTIVLSFNTFTTGMSFRISNISKYLLSNPTITLTCINDISYLSRSYDIGNIKLDSSKTFESDIIYTNCNALRLDYIFIPISRSRYFGEDDRIFNPYNSLDRNIQGVIFIKNPNQ